MQPSCRLRQASRLRSCWCRKASHPDRRCASWSGPAHRPGRRCRWSSAPATTSAERVVLAEVAGLFPDVEVSMTDSLADLGGDSLTAIQLSERLASRYGREIDPSDVFAAESLRDIAHSVVAGP
jgi:acyl carrier protein